MYLLVFIHCKHHHYSTERKYLSVEMFIWEKNHAFTKNHLETPCHYKENCESNKITYLVIDVAI